MSRTLIATFWAGTVLLATANTALSAEPGLATAEMRGTTATWFGIGFADDVFARQATGRSYAERMTGSAGDLTTLFGEMILDEVSVRPFAGLTPSRPFDDFPGDPGSVYAAQDSLTGAVGLRTSALFKSGMGTLEALIDLYLAHELDVEGVRFRTLPGVLRRNIRYEPVEPTQFDFDNALSLRVKGIVPGYFHYETRLRVRSTGFREVTGRISVRF